MFQPESARAACPIHGVQIKRASCLPCNAAYMRTYLRGRRIQKPTYPILERARGRAKRANLPFNLSRQSIVIPASCPVLGMPLKLGASRCDSSPSLDRIIPSLGYVEGNVRVISDRANRLKSDQTLDQLRDRATSSPEHMRPEYQQIVAYLERELLLAEVRHKVEAAGRMQAEWEAIAAYLDRIFACGLPQSSASELVSSPSL